MRWWHKVRAVASKWLLIAGLGLIGYGVVHWWKGFPYPVGIMLAYSAIGGLVASIGLLLRRPETTATLVLATSGFAVSGILLIICFPWSFTPPYFLLMLLWVAGTLRGLFRLRRRSGDRTDQR